MKKQLLLFRRWILSTFVPEWFWPKNVVIAGTIIPIRNEPFSFGTKWILKEKAYENAEISLISEVISSKDVIVEMGTSIGVLTRIMSRMIGENGRIISVECNHELYRSCLRWGKKYRNTDLIEGFGFPVYKVPANLAINGYSDVLGSLGSVVDFTISETKYTNTTLIFDLSKIEQLYQVNPTILVIDIEGSEEILLTVTPEFPLSVKHILIELHAGLYKDGLKSENQIVNVIQKEGFTLIKKIHSSYLFSRNASTPW